MEKIAFHKSSVVVILALSFEKTLFLVHNGQSSNSIFAKKFFEMKNQYQILISVVRFAANSLPFIGFNPVP